MLRECHRVIKPGGRIASYVIHTPKELSPSEELRAAELGPSDVVSKSLPDELYEKSGFSVIVHQDVTETFANTCTTILNAREQLERQLRATEGDEVYDDEQGRKHRMLEGIREGLLKRSMTVVEARKS